VRPEGTGFDPEACGEACEALAEAVAKGNQHQVWWWRLQRSGIPWDTRKDDRHSLVNSEGSLKGLTPVAEDVGW